MVKLLILADDFTGALDTGIQFAKEGIETQIAAGDQVEQIELSEQVQALVIDMETRPLSGEEAYEAVKKTVSWAIDRGIEVIYKKTDSALRGNIGAELQAASDAAKMPIYFLPAFPEIQRVTKDGIHYIQGEPLKESAFGKDPFEPVLYSYIPDIISSWKPVEVSCVSTVDQWETYEEKGGILVFDAQEKEDIQKRLYEFANHGKLRLLAGCAGCASILASMLPFQKNEKVQYARKKGMAVISGSLNPITYQQIMYAQKSGFYRVNLKPEQKLNPQYYQTEEGQKFLEGIGKTCQETNRVVIDTFDEEKEKSTLAYAAEKGINKSDMRFLITKCLGMITQYLVNQNLDYSFFMTGGDTLMGFMKEIKNPRLEPVCELSYGVVLSKLKWNGHELQVISKSGGFGSDSVMTDSAQKLIQD